jgi:bifunctional non-homologous end joining protein LigD
MPATWPDIQKGLAPNAFPLGDETTLAQLKKADPWKDFFKLGKALKRS